MPSGVTHFFVANAFDAMLSDWPYRNGLPMLQGLEKIRSGAGTQFEPKIVEAFLAIPWSRWIGLRESLG